MSIEAIVNEFSAVAANPKGQLKAYKDSRQKVHRRDALLRPRRAGLRRRYDAVRHVGQQRQDRAALQGILRDLLLHHRPARPRDAARRHDGSAGRRDHPDHLRHAAPHEPEHPRRHE